VKDQRNFSTLFFSGFYGLQLVVDGALVCLERVDVACGHSSMSGVAVSFVLYISQASLDGVCLCLEALYGGTLFHSPGGIVLA
jgi:hypothetical protein